VRPLLANGCPCGRLQEPGPAAGFPQPRKRAILHGLSRAPAARAGIFRIDHHRPQPLYAQIIDNLSKAALVGFRYTEIGSRLDAAWFGDPGQRRVYADVQECASLFRTFCLDHNLLDFSLQIQTFTDVLWPQDQVQEYLKNTYRHLIYDNAEEDAPRAHDILRDWIPSFDSTLLLYDENAGYRFFLGSDPQTGRELSDLCEQTIELYDNYVSSKEVIALSDALVSTILSPETVLPLQPEEKAFDILLSRFYPEMLDQVVDQIKGLVADGLPYSEIVIMAPYLSDALRFTITDRLERAGIAWRTHRPSRSLRDETASGTLLTLSALAHPHWNIHPTKFDVSHALMFALNTDLIRAQLLADIVYRQKDLRLSTFEEINAEMQERITFALGEKYTNLRNWLISYRESSPLPLDFFMRKLFGEVLSQPGYGFHDKLDAVRVASSLIDSIKNFRYAMEPSNVKMDSPSFDLGREYLAMLEDGVISAQYLEAWRSDNKDAVLVAPAHTFLMMNRPATVEFWLDPGANSWVERVAQPLTQPHVLSRHWKEGRLWMDADEVTAETRALARTMAGLLSRCRQKIVLALSDLGESGFEQTGTLLRAFQKVLQAQER
jgi:hypothetical protein